MTARLTTIDLQSVDNDEHFLDEYEQYRHGECVIGEQSSHNGNLPVNMFDGFGQIKDSKDGQLLREKQQHSISRTYYTNTNVNAMTADDTENRSFDPQSAHSHSQKNMFLNKPMTTERRLRGANNNRLYATTVFDSKKEKRAPKDILLSQMTPAQVNNDFPLVFDQWQHKLQMIEGVKPSHQLARDHKIVKKAYEKESWAGIPKMNINNLNPDAAYKNFSSSGNILKRDKSSKSTTTLQEREAIRKEVIKQINADVKMHRKIKI